MSSRRATPAKPNRKGQRQCVACREYFPTAHLIRVIRHSATPEHPLPKGESGVISVILPATSGVQAVGKIPNGRSAYCCAHANCIKTASDRKQWQRALKQPLPETVRQQLDALMPEFQAT